MVSLSLLLMGRKGGISCQYGRISVKFFVVELLLKTKYSNLGNGNVRILTFSI